MDMRVTKCNLITAAWQRKGHGHRKVKKGKESLKDTRENKDVNLDKRRPICSKDIKMAG